MFTNNNGLILIADDDPFMRELLGSSLRKNGYNNIIYANDGDKALFLLLKPDCNIKMAFLDISMPGLSGIEVLGKAKINLIGCFFVVVSAHSKTENVVSAIKEGARGFIVKPYTDQKVIDILTKFEKENQR